MNFLCQYGLHSHRIEIENYLRFGEKRDSNPGCATKDEEELLNTIIAERIQISKVCDSDSMPRRIRLALKAKQDTALLRKSIHNKVTGELFSSAYNFKKKHLFVTD